MQVAYRCQLGLDLGNALLAKVDWAPRLWAVDKDSRRHDAAVRQLSAPQGAGVGSGRRRLRRVRYSTSQEPRKQSSTRPPQRPPLHFGQSKAHMNRSEIADCAQEFSRCLSRSQVGLGLVWTEPQLAQQHYKPLAMSHRLLRRFLTNCQRTIKSRGAALGDAMPRGAEQRGSGAPEVARERGGVRPPSVFFPTTT